MQNEKIITLEKERKKRNISNCLSYNNKIKLNTNLSNIKFFEKAIKEISKKYFFAKTVEENNKKLIEEIKKDFQYFNIDIEYITDTELSELIANVHLKYTAGLKSPENLHDYIKSLLPVKCTISDKNDCSFSFYSLLRGRIGEKTCKYYFFYGNTKVKIIDLFSKISEIYFLNEIVNYNNINSEIVSDTLNNLNDKSKYHNSFIRYLEDIINNKKEKLLSLKTIYHFTDIGTSFLINPAKEVLGAIFKEIAFDNEDIVLQEKQLSIMNSDYARAFEKKKNINKETLEAMKNSLFNNYFKEVEFDNDIDLKKIKKIETEFKDTLEYLNPSNSILNFMKKVTLRFRYLGKHKVSGLYFPMQQCLCVDVRDPSSFLHEFMHMIDHHGYKFDSFKLSSKYDFRKIVKKYIEILDKTVDNLPNNSVFKTQYNGKTKYNKDYYCNSAEILARCGEIYLSKILKIDNSLIKNIDNDIVYPCDKELISMIKGYYSSFFTVEEKKQIASSASDNNLCKVNLIVSEEGQFKFAF